MKFTFFGHVHVIRNIADGIMIVTLLLCVLVANVFVHHEPVDGAATESGLDDELSDTEELEVRQKVIYKIGKL